MLVWTNLIEFLKDLIERYPQVKGDLSENKLLEQVLISHLELPTLDKDYDDSNSINGINGIYGSHGPGGGGGGGGGRNLQLEVTKGGDEENVSIRRSHWNEPDESEEPIINRGLSDTRGNGVGDRNRGRGDNDNEDLGLALTSDEIEELDREMKKEMRDGGGGEGKKDLMVVMVIMVIMVIMVRTIIEKAVTLCRGVSIIVMEVAVAVLTEV